MEVRLMNVEAQRLLGALRSVDNHDSVKLAGMTRLDIARNINRLMPAVLAFEKAVGRAQRELLPPGPDSRDANNVKMVEITELSEGVEVYDLVSIEHTALRLDDNPRISGDTIAALAPILKDFDSLAVKSD